MQKDKQLIIFYLNRFACLNYTRLMLDCLSKFKIRLITLQFHDDNFERIDNTLFVPQERLGLLLWSPFFALISFFILLGCRIKSSGTVIYLPSFHPYNFILCLFSKVLGLDLFLTIHDYTMHPGEEVALIPVIQKLCIRLSSKIIFLSEQEFNKALQDGLKEDKAIIVPHPLARNISANRMTYNLPLRLLFVGRMVAYKGAKILLEAMNTVTNASLTMAGAGNWTDLNTDNQNIKTIKRYLSKEEWDSMFKQHHLLILPYIDVSQSGVLSDAISYNLPVALSNIEEFRKEIPDQACIFFEAGSSKSLAESINDLGMDKYDSLKQAMSELYIQKLDIFQKALDDLFILINQKN